MSKQRYFKDTQAGTKASFPPAQFTLPSLSPGTRADVDQVLERLRVIELYIKRLQRVTIRNATRTNVANVNNITVYRISDDPIQIASQATYERVLEIFNESQDPNKTLLIAFENLTPSTREKTIEDNVIPIEPGQSRTIYLEETDAVVAGFTEGNEDTERVRVIEYTLPMYLVDGIGAD